jgi:hypothetical protein
VLYPRSLSFLTPTLSRKYREPRIKRRSARILAYNLGVSGSTSLVTHSDVSPVPVAMTAAKLSGIPHDRLVHFGGPERVIPNFSGYNLHSLIEDGLSQEAKFVEIRLEPRRAKTKVALLLFSSGMTGKPKVTNSLP